MMKKFEDFQKYCVKWIFSEEYISYNTNTVYIRKCRLLNLLPMKYIFLENDLVLFHKIVYELIPSKLPNYLSFFNGISRLRSTHLDSLSIVSNLNSRSFTESYLRKSFYFRTHTNWNDLPFSLREVSSPISFKKELKKYLWSRVFEEYISDDLDDEFEELDNG